MSMLKVCAHPGCRTLTLGGLCVEHEQLPVQRARADRPTVRRRPRPVQEVHAAVTAGERRPDG